MVPAPPTISYSCGGGLFFFPPRVTTPCGLSGEVGCPSERLRGILRLQNAFPIVNQHLFSPVGTADQGSFMDHASPVGKRVIFILGHFTFNKRCGIGRSI